MSYGMDSVPWTFKLVIFESNKEHLLLLLLVSKTTLRHIWHNQHNKHQISLITSAKQKQRLKIEIVLVPSILYSHLATKIYLTGIWSNGEVKSQSPPNVWLQYRSFILGPNGLNLRFNSHPKLSKEGFWFLKCLSTLWPKCWLCLAQEQIRRPLGCALKA